MTVTRINWDTLLDDPDNWMGTQNLSRAHNANDNDFATMEVDPTVGVSIFCYFADARNYNLPPGETITQVELSMKLKHNTSSPAPSFIHNFFGVWSRESDLAPDNEADPWTVRWQGEDADIVLPKTGTLNDVVIPVTDITKLQIRVQNLVNFAGTALPEA